MESRRVFFVAHMIYMGSFFIFRKCSHDFSRGMSKIEKLDKTGMLKMCFLLNVKDI